MIDWSPLIQYFTKNEPISLELSPVATFIVDKDRSVYDYDAQLFIVCGRLQTEENHRKEMLSFIEKLKNDEFVKSFYVNENSAEVKFYLLFC